jgi:hypothetical protein
MEPIMLKQLVVYKCKTTCQELWEDIRSTNWLLGLGWFSFICIWCGGLIVAIILVSLIFTNSVFLTYEGSFSPCLPDGSFSLTPDKYNPWTVSDALEITFGFGNLSFAKAKLIDVIWDVVSVLPLLSSQIYVAH